jgi:lipoyl(octanoyl) transferase
MEKVDSYIGVSPIAKFQISLVFHLAFDNWKSDIARVPPLFESLDFIDDREPHDASLNMAIDETLLRCLAAPTLRIYRWRRPAVSFGYFEKFESVKTMHPARDLVRRWTGGGIVTHGNDLTYSLLVPAGSRFMELSLTDSYRAIHEWIASALRASGVLVSLADGAPSSSRACFESPVRHDIVHDGRKIAGAAQRRTRFGLLHQGSIQSFNVPDAFALHFVAALSQRVVGKALDATTRAAASQLAETKYATEEWLRKF